ncbi:hypothetical protein [Neptuniibacter caesariensis]|uniref:Uncharacterized protein n=1 Tax=Neptuniibacter caesariensis TaxID=207954 RepID=A0A7U8GRA7_NEPCE|nr:hypothetical protein [Neptuniibacter caesariensis]EAR61167.1 hypothetical protein MED92_04914 [Oceanospirillum sp. MED92] [Neptuniibacter caesariensis]
MLGYIAALWGITGICMLLGSAIYRLSAIGLQTFSYDLSWYHWAALLFSVVFMGFFEGYRGFQQAWSPRVAARILYLSQNASALRVILAPLFCMGFFSIVRKRMIVTYCLTLGIVTMVMLVHQLDQPWRGIVDLGVVTGLAWGLASLLLFTVQAFFGRSFQHSPEMP